jgi:hypothetical protein
MSSGRQAWPAERIALLEQLWRDGLTALQISRHLGTTRSAVIGKLNRLKLLGIERTNLTIGQRRSARANLYRRGKPRPIKLPALPKSIMRLPMKNIPLEALTARSCRWIEADPKLVRVVLYCGEETLLGTAWCPAHYARAYRGVSMEVAA